MIRPALIAWRDLTEKLMELTGKLRKIRVIRRLRVSNHFSMIVISCNHILLPRSRSKRKCSAKFLSRQKRMLKETCSIFTTDSYRHRGITSEERQYEKLRQSLQQCSTRWYILRYEAITTTRLEINSLTGFFIE